MDGAEFELHFTKTRGETPRPPKLTVKLRADEDGILQFLFETKYDAKPEHQRLLKIFSGGVGEKWRPFKTQAELVEELSLAKGTVSKHLTKLRKANLISNSAQSGIQITDRGVATLKKIFGELRGGPPDDKIIKAIHVEDMDEAHSAF